MPRHGACFQLSGKLFRELNGEWGYGLINLTLTLSLTQTKDTRGRLIFGAVNTVSSMALKKKFQIKTHPVLLIARVTDGSHRQKKLEVVSSVTT